MGSTMQELEMGGVWLMKGPTWLEEAKVITPYTFPVPRSFVRMRFPGGGKVCGED